MNYIWQPPKQEPTDTQQSQPVTPPTTAGTEQVPFVKKALPWLILSAVLASSIPYIFTLFGKEYLALGNAVRNYANITIVASLLVVFLKQVTERK